jgi:hypothetical protein
MNNTRTTLTALVAVFLAATLVVGTLSTTTQSASAAYGDTKKVRPQQEEKGNSKNGNTITIQKCKQLASQSGWDNNQAQECENLICTHPGNNATCTQEGARAAAQTPTPTPQPPNTTLRVIKTVVCSSTDPDCSLPNFCVITVVASSNPQAFKCQSAIGNGILVTLQPGENFFIREDQIITRPGENLFEVTFEGDCLGPIAAGQHLTCTVVNTESEGG